MKLSVIIPAYNEKSTIAEVISRVEAVRLEKEIIVVDDGSTDGTVDVLRTIRDSGQILLHEPRARWHVTRKNPPRDSLVDPILDCARARHIYSSAERPLRLRLKVCIRCTCIR